MKPRTVLFTKALVWLVLSSLVTGRAVAQERKNLADERPAPTVNPRLTEHSRKMAQQIYRVTDNVYSAVGFGGANVTMIVGRDGVIIVDTMESVDAAKNILAEFRKLTDKPVKAIVYTHNHTDHTMGVKAFTTEEDVKAGKVDIYAHETMMNTVISNASVIAPILGLRSAYSFGVMLETGPEGKINQGLGPQMVFGQRSFIAPTNTFKDALDVEVAGVKLRLIYAPSETDDEIIVWLPDQKLLQTAEVIQGETFPNLHTIRGTAYRDPVKWFKTIDLMRRLGAEHLVPSHGRSVSGKDKVEDLLTAYRDAIQYVHDQTVRQMNKGLTPDEIAEVVAQLPPHLANHPWLGEFYGTVKHSVRQIYQGYLGWFNGDPTTLDPTPRAEQAKRYVALMGGRDAVLKAAQTAADNGDHQWAAELLTHLIRLNPNDQEACKRKAHALRQLAYKTQNTNWRNWYITSARELDGTMNKAVAAGAMSSLAAPEIMQQLPPGKFFEALTVRLDPLKSADVHLTAAFRITDTAQSYALEIRRGVAQLHEMAPPSAEVTLHLTQAQMQRIIARQTTFANLLQAGEIRADGNVALLARFNSFFDPPVAAPPALTAR
ncbi:MAG: MBL fold metallo-hydrolase [Acidobacteria bacterium]|nr:MBL fold metallo-hydrolase [Acidobacteriota bacterium]